MREQLINFMWQTGLLQELVWRVCFFAPTKDHHQYGNNTPLPEKHSVGKAFGMLLTKRQSRVWFE